MTATSPTHRSDLHVHLPLVRTIARRIHRRAPPQVDLDDLVGEGMLGLVAAAQLYDDSRPVPFEAYARHRIHGAIMDSLRAADFTPRTVRGRARRLDEARTAFEREHGRAPSEEELASALDLDRDRLRDLKRKARVRTVVSLDAPARAEETTPLVERIEDEGPDGLDRLIDDEQRRAVIDAVRSLPERERAVISLYYLHGLTLREVGETLGVTESRACQLRGQGVRALRKSLADRLG